MVLWDAPAQSLAGEQAEECRDHRGEGGDTEVPGQQPVVGEPEPKGGGEDQEYDAHGLDQAVSGEPQGLDIGDPGKRKGARQPGK